MCTYIHVQFNVPNYNCSCMYMRQRTITITCLLFTIQYLKDISECVYLARPLVSFCCQKFSLLSDMQQKVQQIQLHTKKGSTKDSKLKDHSTSGPELMETNEDDDVFSSTGIGATLKTGVTARKTTDAEKESSKTEETSRTGLAGRKRSKSGSLTVTIESTSGNQGDAPSNDDPNKTDSKTNDKSCKHHSSILLQLSCIIQIMAVQCPTAYIHVSLTGKGSSRDASPKTSTPLDKLPYRLSEMPLPKKGIFSAGRKVLYVYLRIVHVHVYASPYTNNNYYCCQYTQ